MNDHTMQNFYFHPVWTTFHMLFSASISGFLGYMNFIDPRESGLAGIILFLFSLVYVRIALRPFVATIRGTPAITIYHDHFYDYQNGLNYQRGEVESIRLRSNGQYYYLKVLVKDKREMISRIAYPWKRAFLDITSILAPKSIGINLTIIRGDSESIMEAIRRSVNCAA